MTESANQALSDGARALLAELRAWVANLPEKAVSVRENHDLNYGGVLFEVRPTEVNAMHFTVGLGSSPDVDFFWGDDYRWEGWKATPRDVLDICEAIRKGDVIEETWRLLGFVIERRCYIRPSGRPAGDASPPMPRSFKRWARLSVRTYAPWFAAEAA